MDIQIAFREVGTYRGAAEIRGTTPKTVRRVVEAARRADPAPPRQHNYDSVGELVAERVERTKGRISAKRVLPVARAAGYGGSARNFRRLVADAKAIWREAHHRGRRPGVWAPGEVLLFDWGEIGPLYVFCAVLAWSRWRFVAFAADLGAVTTMSCIAECLEALDGVPAKLLTDRMGCLKGGTVAGVVIPTADYVRFSTHYGFEPDFCLGDDPESKGLVENLVGYVKSDLMIPEELVVTDLARANHEARRWMEEVNGALHSEICAVPAERLATERELLGPLPSLRARLGTVVVRKVNRLSCVRFGSARYSVPTTFIGRQVELRVVDDVVTMYFLGKLIATHLLAAPGEDSVHDAHYGGPRPAPRRAVRPKTAAEKAFCSLGPVAETFIKRAAAAGITSLKGDLEELSCLEVAHGREALVAALERAVAFGRFRAHDVRAILAAGTGVATPRGPGQAVIVPLPSVGRRPLSDYAIAEGS
jgi:transposase